MVGNKENILATTALLALVATLLAVPASAGYSTYYEWGMYTSSDGVYVHLLALGEQSSVTLDLQACSQQRIRVRQPVSLTLSNANGTVTLYASNGMASISNTTTTVQASVQDEFYVDVAFDGRVTISVGSASVSLGNDTNVVLSVLSGVARWVEACGSIVDGYGYTTAVQDEVTVLQQSTPGITCGGDCVVAEVDALGNKVFQGLVSGEYMPYSQQYTLVASKAGDKAIVFILGSNIYSAAPTLQGGTGECSVASVEFNASGTFLCIPVKPVLEEIVPGLVWSAVNVGNTTTIRLSRIATSAPEYVSLIVFSANGTPVYALSARLDVGDYYEVNSTAVEPGVRYVYFVVTDKTYYGPGILYVEKAGEKSAIWSEAPLLAALVAAAPLFALALRPRTDAAALGMILYGLIGYKLSVLLGADPSNAALAAALSVVLGIILLIAA